MMKNIDVDFNDLARNGKVRVWLADTNGAVVGERVLLVEQDEEMSMQAVFAEIDGNYAYFDLALQEEPVREFQPRVTVATGVRQSANRLFGFQPAGNLLPA